MNHPHRRNHGEERSIQHYRERVAEPRLQNAARTEFGKLGFDIDDILNSSDSPRYDRNRARRMISRLQDDIRDGKVPALNKDGSENQAPADAISWAAAIVNIHDLQEENEEAIERALGGGGGSTAMRDINGQRVGTMLSNQVLRSEADIARALGAHRDDDQRDLTLTNFIRGVANMRTTESVRNALSEGTGSSGGYTVPTILMPGILSALVPASSTLSAGAAMVMLDQQANKFSIAGINSIPTAAWRNESGAVAESDPTFLSIPIQPRSLAFRFKLSRELLMDAPDLEEALRTAIAAAFAKEIDRAGLRGSGTAPEIKGLLNTAGIASVTNGANGAALDGYANFISAMQAIKTADAPDPTAAIMHPRSQAKLDGLLDTTGQPVRRPPVLESWKMIGTSQIPVNLTVGTSNDCSEIYVGDFTQMVYFFREGFTVQMVTELYAETGEIGFIAHTRADVAVRYPAAFGVIKGVRP